jgi:hypothetical protein
LLWVHAEAIVSSGIEAGYWRDVIGAEYDSLPRLSLTVAQAMRLWSIDEDIARRVLDSYVESGYLVVASDGRYRRADAATCVDCRNADARSFPANPEYSAVRVAGAAGHDLRSAGSSWPESCPSRK